MITSSVSVEKKFQIYNSVIITNLNDYFIDLTIEFQIYNSVIITNMIGYTVTLYAKFQIYNSVIITRYKFKKIL